jgi:DNA-binding NarL/FixJ family response regulator
VVDQLHLVASVLRLLAAGWRNQEIARDLVVTLETVKKHTSHILDEFGAANRTVLERVIGATGLNPSRS